MNDSSRAVFSCAGVQLLDQPCRDERACALLVVHGRQAALSRHDLQALRAALLELDARWRERDRRAALACNLSLPLDGT